MNSARDAKRRRAKNRNYLSFRPSRSQIQFFGSHGYLIIKNVIPKTALQNLRLHVAKLIQLKLSDLSGGREKRAIGGPLKFDRSLKRLKDRDPFAAISVYAAGSRLSKLQELCAVSNFQVIAQTLLDSQTLFQTALSIRYDEPSAEHQMIPWHQDYPFIQDSLKSVVFWFPLRNITLNGGGVRLIPGSHREGFRAVKPTTYNGKYWLKLGEEPEPFPKESIVPFVEAGDALVMNSLLIHRSESNKSKWTRWTGQVRYGDFTDSYSVRLGWPESLLSGGNFEETHEDFIYNKYK